MASNDNSQEGGKKTITERIGDLENVIHKLSSVIEGRKTMMASSNSYCKKHALQNSALDFVVDAYNNSYTRIIDDKIRQMQHFAKLEGYLDKMLDDGNYSIDELKRAKRKQRSILERINETRYNLEKTESLLSLNVSNII